MKHFFIVTVISDGRAVFMRRVEVTDLTTVMRELCRDYPKAFIQAHIAN